MPLDYYYYYYYYIAEVVNPVLLPFLWQEGDLVFQQDSACPHTAAVMQYARHGVQKLPWPARSTDLSPIEHGWDMMKWDVTLSLSPEPATTIAELRQQVEDTCDTLLQDDIQHLYDCLYPRIHAYIAPRGGYTVY